LVGKRNIRNYFNCSEIITFEVIEMKQAKVLTEKELKKAIKSYQSRQRRFGGLA
jgi:hypothetical protein